MATINGANSNGTITGRGLDRLQPEDPEDWTQFQRALDAALAMNPAYQGREGITINMQLAHLKRDFGSWLNYRNAPPELRRELLGRSAGFALALHQKNVEGGAIGAYLFWSTLNSAHKGHTRAMFRKAKSLVQLQLAGAELARAAGLGNLAEGKV